MTKTELVKLIKEVVKREVKKQVKEILIKEQRLSKVSSKKSKPITEKQFKEPIRRKYKEYTDGRLDNDKKRLYRIWKSYEDKKYGDDFKFGYCVK